MAACLLAAVRFAIPKSEVVRETIFDFYERIGRLSKRERGVCLAPSTRLFSGLLRAATVKAELRTRNRAGFQDVPAPAPVRSRRMLSLF